MQALYIDGLSEAQESLSPRNAPRHSSSFSFAAGNGTVHRSSSIYYIDTHQSSRRLIHILRSRYFLDPLLSSVLLCAPCGGLLGLCFEL